MPSFLAIPRGAVDRNSGQQVKWKKEDFPLDRDERDDSGR